MEGEMTDKDRRCPYSIAKLRWFASAEQDRGIPHDVMEHLCLCSACAREYAFADSPNIPAGEFGPHCASARELAEFLDGDYDDAPLFAHLQECEDCQIRAVMILRCEPNELFVQIEDMRTRGQRRESLSPFVGFLEEENSNQALITLAFGVVRRCVRVLMSARAAAQSFNIDPEEDPDNDALAYFAGRRRKPK